MPNGGLHGQDYPQETDEEVVERVLRQRNECREECNRLREENGDLRKALDDLKSAIRIVNEEKE